MSRTQAQERARFTYLKTADVADELKVGRSHVAELVKAGAFPDLDDGTPGAIDVAAGARPEYRIHPESLKLFQRARKVA